ncbi:uncharacterized protein LOC142982070 [Anticarsia gemmatalis]|uniref:uncharacterized protein LOC142982070 n=1 Tax=Anticarsia gemmatalis TaxID=129554 RepID=UPI003F774F8D
MSDITRVFLQDLLRDDHPDVTLHNFEYEPGTKPGDNVGSALFRVFLTGENKSKEPWKSSIIYKQLTKHKLQRQHFINAFRNEALFYNTVWPVFEKFQAQWNIEKPFVIPKCYLASEYCVVLQDLKKDGFAMMERKQGLDVKQFYLVLKKLAHFHALSLAMKTQKPEEFYKLVDGEKGIREFLFVEEKYHLMKHFFKKLADDSISMVEEELSGSEDKEMYLERFRRYCDDGLYILVMGELVKPVEPLAVICHGDCWNNNFMFKYVNGELDDMRLVDYQLVRYASPALDLVSVLYLSMERKLRTKHYTALLNYYTDELYTRLQEMGYENGIKGFNRDTLFEMLQKEIKRCLPYGMGVALMLFPIMTCSSEEAFDPYKEIHDDEPEVIAVGPVQTCNPECSRKLTELVVDLVDEGIL